MAFGRRKVPFGGEPRPPGPVTPGAGQVGAGQVGAGPVGADGVGRGFGVDLSALRDDLSRATGEQDIKRQVAESLVRQHERRVRLKAELLARYGCHAIRPFFILGTVFDMPVGQWLIQAMRLLPFDEWNVVYLPTDAATAAVLYLPLHPELNIAVLDEWVIKQVSAYHSQYLEIRTRIDSEFARTGDAGLVRAFDVDAEKMREAILQWVATITPTVIEGIAAVQRGGR